VGSMLFRRALAWSAAVVLVSSLIGSPPITVASSPHLAVIKHAVAVGTPTTPTLGRRAFVDVRRLTNHAPVRHQQGITPVPAAHVSTAAPHVVGPPPASEASLTANPASGQAGFQGFSSSSGPATNYDPPDPWVGVGPDYVVQVVNTSLRITDRSGASEITDVTLTDFFGTSGPVTIFNSDPRVIYDSLHGRWIATEVEWDCDTTGASFGHGYVGVRVSQTADPTGIWGGFYMGWNDYLPDYPSLGTSTDKVALSADFYDMVGGGNCANSTSHAGLGIVVMDWTKIVGATIPPVDFYTGGPEYGTFRVAAQTPATSASLQIVGQLGLPTVADVDLLTISGLVGAGGGTTVAEVDVTAANLIQAFLDPIAPRQPSGTLTSAIDSRPTDAIWQGNRLTFVSTQACTPSGDTDPRDCVRVSQLDTSTPTPSVTKDFLIAEIGEDLYLGGIGASGNGALFAVWTRSSGTAEDYPSSYGAYNLPSDPANSISPPELLFQGQADYTGSRWGDYVGVSQDPQDPNAVWQGNEYASSDGGWGTYVSQLKVGSGATYVPIAPVRVLDTRIGTGLTGVFTSNVPRTFSVAGDLGIPADAVAVTGNLTVTQQTAKGFVALTVAPTVSPTTSTLNFPVGDNRANNVTIPLSPTGALSAVYKAVAAKTAHLIFDVTGYFLADAAGATYTPVTPARILDSRASSQVGPYSTPFVASVPREVSVWNQGGVPSTAIAITGNLTVTGQTSLGYLTLSNVNTSSPATSTLNFPVGDNRANGVSVALTGTGSLWAVYKAPAGKVANVILDVTGYYEPGSSGLRFFPLNPGRALDGRPGTTVGLPGTFSANSSRALAVDGHLGVPVGAAAITGNLTVTQQTAKGFAAMTPDPTNTPATSTLNFPVGDNRANGVTVPLNGLGFTSLVYKAVSGTTYLILDITGYFQ